MSEEKNLIAKRKVQMDHSEEIVAAWFNQQTEKEIHQSVVVKMSELASMSLNSKHRKTKNTEGCNDPCFIIVCEHNGILSDALLLSKAEY